MRTLQKGNHLCYSVPYVHCFNYLWYSNIYNFALFFKMQLHYLDHNQFHHFLNFFYYYYYFTLQFVLVLPYINMHLPRVYTCSPSWSPLPPPSPYHPSGSSQCISPKLPVSCIKPGLGDLFLIWYYTCFNAILPNHPPRF